MLFHLFISSFFKDNIDNVDNTARSAFLLWQAYPIVVERPLRSLKNFSSSSASKMVFRRENALYKINKVKIFAETDDNSQILCTFAP